jgi:hypothetical protein
VQGQDLFSTNGVVDPLRQLDLDPEKPTIEPVFTAYGSRIDQAEAVGLFFIASTYIGLDTRTGEAASSKG